MADQKKPQTQDEEVPQDALKELELEKSIKTFHAGIALKRQEVQKLNEMINHTLETDKTYALQEEKVKEEKMKQQKTKDQLMSISSVVEAKEEMKELRSEMKDLSKHLSNRLLEYSLVSEQRNITMDNGETYEIKRLAKLVKQSSKYKP